MKKTLLFGQVKDSSMINHFKLPYLEHKHMKMSQSMAILRYVARNTGFEFLNLKFYDMLFQFTEFSRITYLLGTYGQNDDESSLIDMYIDGEEDWRNRYTDIMYGKAPYSNYVNSVFVKC